MRTRFYCVLFLALAAVWMSACTGGSGSSGAPAITSGTALVYTGTFQNAAELMRTVEVLRKRIELYYAEHGDEGLFGRTTPPSAVSYGADQRDPQKILIAVGDRNASRLAGLKLLLPRSGRLEFKLLASDQDAGQIERIRDMKESGEYRAELERYDVAHEASPDRWILLENEGTISGRSLASAEYTTEDFNPAVGFAMNAEGSRLFRDVTSRNVGRQIAIVLEGEVQSAPVIRGAVDGRGVITGIFTPEEANAFVLVLKTGELPVKLTLESEETIGPK